MTTKLNQINAVVQGKKSRTQKRVTEAHRAWNPDAIMGVTRTYVPKDDDGDVMPPENKAVYLSVATEVGVAVGHLIGLWDVVLTQDLGNTHAVGTIEADGLKLEGVPVTSLLFLEKQATDLHTLVSALPVLPPDKEWEYDSNRGCFATKPIETLRTQKVLAVLKVAPATKEHPEQCQTYNRDVTAGTWSTTYLSSAIPVQKRDDMIRRVEALQDALKRSRESANSAEVEQVKMGQAIADYVFGDLLK